MQNYLGSIFNHNMVKHIQTTIAFNQAQSRFAKTKSSNFMKAFITCITFSSFAITAHADLCKDVKFKFTNNHSMGRTIKVTKISYWDNSDQKWRTNDIGNKECKPDGKPCTTSGENLEHVENEPIEKIRFTYKELADGKWTDNIEGGDKQTNDSSDCIKGKLYDGKHENGFSITGVK